MVNQQLITTASTLEGYKITRHLGVIRGITVRSRSVIGNFGGSIQSIFGGKLSIYVNLCEQAREEAYQLMIQHANEQGANAIINMRYDANEVMQGITEVLAYGTAVVVEQV
ncbi:MAG: YbjQ family protein [Sphingobacteriales bacterium]|nr:YbjQ family protein [Sphingobacteriales bacterium]